MDKKNFYSNMSIYQYPSYILRHPVDGFNELKNNNKYSLSIANIILILWVLLTVLNWGYIDFDFKTKFSDVSLPQVMMTTILIFSVTIISNWCFTTLMDGKGRFTEIWISCAYALLPYIILGYIRIILSFVLVHDEGVFLSYINIAGVLWSTFLFFLGLSVVHDYSVKKTIASVFLTIMGDVIVLFFMVLISGLITQIYSFVMTVYSEITFRMQ